MQSLLIEIVIAALLALLLWSMDRGRSDLRFRLWVVGWTLVLLRLVSLLWHPLSSFVLLLREAHFALLDVLAGVCFILSDPAIVRSRSLLTRTAILATVPALFSMAIILFRPDALWMLYPSIVVAHALAIALSRKYAGLQKSQFVTLSALHFLSASWMLGALACHKPQVVLASIPAELFLINAVLFSRNYSLRNPGNLLAVTGFLLWATSSFVTIALREIGTSDRLFPRSLDLPQFLVAIGMVIIILEKDAMGSRQLVREYELLYNNNPFPLWIYDLKTLKFLSANPASARLHGYTVAELCKKKLTDVVHPDMIPVLMSEAARSTTQPLRQSLHLRKDGTPLPMNVTAYDISFRGRAARIALGEDVSEREQMASQLMYQVQHDLLTGLPNRTTFLQELEQMFAKANNDKTGCAVMVLHINRFEKINANFGHGVGDGLLKEITKRLQSHLRADDAVGRTGSREFTIAFPSTSNDAALEARARDLLHLFDEPIHIKNHRIEASLSMGLAIYPEDSDDASSLLRDAARAQSLTQVVGVDNFVRLSRELALKAQEESRVEGLIQRALLENGFEVHYQPIINTTGELYGLEALLRLHDVDGRLVSPAIFIPIAESTGAIIAVGRWVISEVCRQLKEWTDAGLEAVPVAINASALQIVQPNFCADVTSTLVQFAIAPELVHLELTESSVMPQGSLALENMLELAARGIKFSIDDFGTGFSSLDRLHQLPVSVLKIDRSFVMRMLDPDGTLPIVNTIISMAHSLNVGVVAEGVENEEQFHALFEMGCDHFQGYFFSEPVTAKAVAALMSAKPSARQPNEISPPPLAKKKLIGFPSIQFDVQL